MSAATTGPSAPQEPLVPAPLPRLRLRLPGNWWQVPLHDRTEARASVRRLVAATVGPADDRAALRIELERRVLGALDDAIDGDGQAFHVALSIVPGAPIPVTAMVSLPAQQLTPAVGTSATATMAILERGLADLTPGGAGALHRFTAGPSEVARRTRRHVLVDPDSDETLPTVAVEYWMTVPGTKRFVLVAFSTPAGELEEPLTGLFDQIVRVSSWE
ncbi:MULTISPECIES: hypothetical protein [Oerskovia]|uniref:Uncharacterized protein n=2 Tax=Oerskovia TaxID=162491 RepID=A0ABR8V106_9CELL|nr:MULTISPECIES: hypothetical protein [Oerskovia]MBD7998468.1 hypothetical protein [Oerskovia gallyi]MBM7499022.1 hypothetical protein [Oerskovia paurometabola]